jgi:hypothetical protein
MRQAANITATMLCVTLAFSTLAEDPAAIDVGAELARMFDEDQRERRTGKLSPENDRNRREQVQRWIQEEKLVDAADYYYAGMIFQHSADRSGRDHLVAHVLATTAALKGDRRGHWLSAAALDRFLDFNGMEQMFGTQFERDDEGVWHPGDVDALITEPLRLEFDLPDVETNLKRAASWNEN